MTHGQAKHRIATIAHTWRDAVGIDYDRHESMNVNQLQDDQAAYDEAAAVLGWGQAEDLFHEVYHSP